MPARTYTFRSVVFWSSATNGAADDVRAGLLVRGVVPEAAAQGDGEWLREEALAGTDIELTLTYRVVVASYGALRAMIEGLGGGPRGTLATPYGTWAGCVLASATEEERRFVGLEAGPGYLVRMKLVFRRSA